MGRSLVFVGDSITDAGRREAGRAPLGSGYVAEIAARLAEASVPAHRADWRIANVGISGNRVRDLLARWDDDVETLQPDVLSVLIGINDVWRRFSDDDPTTAEAFEHTYRGLLANRPDDRLLVLCEPFLIPVQREQDAWHDDLDGKRDVARRLATEFDAVFVPFHDLMTADALELGAATLTTDGVHLTPAGHARLAEHWLAHAGPALAGPDPVPTR
jgi:lysophospholipase L1-like esterase